MREYVILVNERDEVVGFEEKSKAHRDGMLHRAFSVFIFNSSGLSLLQKRALTKYHSGGMWSNACCSHPRPGESIEAAAHRRLKEEMGFDCNLHELFSFVYRVELNGGLVEHELDHVMVGRFDGEPKPDAQEVEDWQWVLSDELSNKMKEHPDQYTYWFRLSFDRCVSCSQVVSLVPHSSESPESMIADFQNMNRAGLKSAIGMGSDYEDTSD